MKILGSSLASSPLRHPAFRSFYVGSIGSALGYTMQATIAAWLMATLTPSALMVALVQSASTAPSLLFGVIAGALADIVDRRRIILVTQVLLVASTLLLGAATLAGWVEPVGLLAFTFLIGSAFTFYMPAHQASINELVGRAELARAVALGAVAFNVARAMGPALAGAIAAWLGSGIGLIVSGGFFAWMIVALRGWRARDRPAHGFPETVLSGVISGLRYARHTPAMRSLILRNLTFSVCASAFWALLPTIARDQLGLGAGGYGMLSAGFGLGAVGGALAMPRLLHSKSLSGVVTLGVLLWAFAIVLVGLAGTLPLAVAGACGAGMAWVSVLASLSAGTQSSAPAWVRARALAINLVAVQASLALGSALWGALASTAGTRIALVSSGALMILLHLGGRHRALTMGSDADVTPGAQLPDLTISNLPEPDDGPVLIQVEYRIDPARHDEFRRAVRAVEPVRRRNGANSWRLFRDLGEDDRFVERFIIASWAEYARLRTRMTVADRALLERVEDLQRPESAVRVSRLIGVEID
jgi:MFS family permease